MADSKGRRKAFHAEVHQRRDLTPHKLKKHEEKLLKDYGMNPKQYLHIYTGPDFMRLLDREIGKEIEIRR